SKRRAEQPALGPCLPWWCSPPGGVALPGEAGASGSVERPRRRRRLVSPIGLTKECKPPVSDLPGPSGLPRVQLPSRVEVIEVHQRVEDQKVAALRLTAPDRVVRERDHVALVERDVDDGGMLRDLGTVFDEP